MAAENGKALDEAQIRELIEDRVKAVREKDVNALLSSYVPDVLSFDVINPLHYVGSDATRKRAEEWLVLFLQRPNRLRDS